MRKEAGPVARRPREDAASARWPDREHVDSD